MLVRIGGQRAHVDRPQDGVLTMTRITVARRIAAPVAIVFGAIADIEKLPETNPGIVSVEFLSNARRGLGTRFRETRRMQQKELVTELEVTEFTENERARMVADTHGTVWDTVFEVTPSGDHTELRITMDARPHALLPRVMTPFLKGFFKKGIEKHLDSLAEYCASRARSAEG